LLAGAVQFMAYEETKKYAIARKNRVFAESSVNSSNVVWTPAETILMSITSKVIASVTTYPYQVIRSRLQSNNPVYSNSLVECVRTTYHNEGLRGFYRGCLVNTIKVIPSACLVFLSYEQIQQFFKRQARSRLQHTIADK
jgi:solute carrier family 25 folate transporter 32